MLSFTQSVFRGKNRTGEELTEKLWCPVILEHLPFSFPSAWVSKESESIAACSAGIADACHRWLKNASSKRTQLKLAKQTSSKNLKIKQKDSCSFFPLEVPIITVLCFQHLPELSVKQFFLSPHFPRICTWELGWGAMWPKDTKPHSKSGTEAGLLKQLLNLTLQPRPSIFNWETPQSTQWSIFFADICLVDKP